MGALNRAMTRFSPHTPGLAAGSGAAGTILTVGWITMAVAVFGTGMLGIVVGNFALQWQPVPDDVPGRTLLAYLTASMLILLAAGFLISRSKIIFAGSLTAVYFVWTLLLHGPRVIAEPLNILQWLAFCEILAMSSGLLVLTASLSANAAFSGWGQITGTILFAACLPVFGLSHFANLEFTAGMVPAWMPARLFWASFTGIGHIAAGVAILTYMLGRPIWASFTGTGRVAARVAKLTNGLARLGSFLLAAMMSGFVLLLHVPDAVNDPTSRHAWTMLCMATSLAGAAWAVAGSLAVTRNRE